MPRDEGPRLLLNGLDGGNPLGFLAAVGTLRTVALSKPCRDWRMKWRSRGAIWSPELVTSRGISPEELVELLASALDRATPEFDFDKNLTVSPKQFRNVAYNAQRCASFRERGHADFMAAFGCDALVADDGKTIQDTALRTMSGVGRQHFLGTMKQLVKETGARDLHRSLFEPWTYPDRKLGLHWDPQEVRRYALRWANPSDGDGVPTMRGANRLAVEALPLLPTAPNGKRLDTTGFMRSGRNTAFSWPIWDCPLSVDVVRSVLAMAETQTSEPDRSALHAMGIVEVYRSHRITVDRYRNFAIASPA